MTRPVPKMMTDSDPAAEAFHASLTRKLMVEMPMPEKAGKEQQQSSNNNKRITNEAIVAAGEVLRLFVQEARHRAGIEAECEQESAVMKDDESEGKENSSAIPVRADHISKIAAEMLMDFS